MEYINEVWRTDLYKLQQEAPKARAVPRRNAVTSKPTYYGKEFHGCISRENVEIIMKSQTSGSYLIRNGVRTSGTYTLVIKFDDLLKNYKLFYDKNTEKHYVGYKYFITINDLVQDGLIHFYIESRGASELKKIAECNIYKNSPFYKTRYYTLQRTMQRMDDLNQDEYKKNNMNNEEDIQRKSIATENDIDVGLKNSNLFDSKNNIKISSNTLLNTEKIEKVDSTFYPSIHHSSLINSHLIVQNLRSSGQPNRLYLDDENFPSENAGTSSSSSVNTKKEAKETFESCYLTNSTHSSSSDLSLDNQITSESKLELLLPKSRSDVNQYTNCFGDQEKAHNFKTHSFKGPTWCDFCTHFIWGLVAQGVKCQNCGFQAHRKCSDRVPPDCLPVLNSFKRIFGVELTSLGRAENRGVPLILMRLVSLIEERALELEGIYRVSGNAETIDDVKAELDKDFESVDLQTDTRLTEMHNVASLIKLFFRQLPIPLITLDISSKLTDLFKSQGNEKVRLEQMKDCLLRLPLVHYATLKYFMTHLRKISMLANINKMNVGNLAIIFAPSLINHQPIPDNGTVVSSPLEMQEFIHRTLQSSVNIIEDLIRYKDILFIEERQI